MEEDKRYLQRSLELAKESLDKGGFPAGALVVKDGEIVGEGISIGNILHDPTSHAEIDAIRKACQTLDTSDLSGSTLYESIQACLMCFSAANWAGITRIIYGLEKSDAMVEKRYYEGKSDNEKINYENSRKVEMIYIPHYKEESLALLSSWEKKFV